MESNEDKATLRSTVDSKAHGAYSYAQRSLDSVMPQSSRQEAYDSTKAYAVARPILFSFFVSQLLFSFLPLLLFTVFSLSTVAFALGAALVFALFWIGVAFMLLVPTLLLTSSVAVLVWGWAVGSFLVARWLYVRAPVGVRGDVAVGVPGKGAVRVVKDEGGVDGEVVSE